MARKRPKKAVEFRDTSLPFSAEYDYSQFTKNRCLFFYCKARNVRKMINYAANFIKTSNICVVYVYGRVVAETMLKNLADKQGHIMLLAASGITEDDFSAIDDYKKWIASYKSCGYATDDGPTEWWYKTYNQPDEPEFYQKYTDGLEIMSRYKAAMEHISTAEHGTLDVLSNFGAEGTISGAADVHDSELLNIIRALYPYGVEADTNDIQAVRRLKIRKLCEAAYAGEVTADVQKLGINFGGGEQLCLWDNVTVGACECLEMLKKFCAEGIREKGSFSVANAWIEFTKPPYGAYDCNWYEYIFAVAMSDYTKPGYFFGDGTLSEPIKSSLQSGAKYGMIFVQTKEQDEFRLLLAKLFDIENPQPTTQGVTSQAKSWVQNNIKYAPLDCVDHRLHEILDTKCYCYDELNMRLVERTRDYYYEFGYEKEYLPWLRKNFDDLYVRIRNLDQKFCDRLAREYGQKKAELFCRANYMKGNAVGWLQTQKMLEERVKEFMKAQVCMECGRGFKWGYQAMEIKEGRMFTYDFSEKDIVGINKKLLDRNSDEYLCIPCLAEYLETTEAELWTKMNEFKEEGCTLFL